MAELPGGNSYPDNKVSTNGITLFDDSGMMLRLGYLGDSFSMFIADPVKLETGKNSYPEKNRHSFLLTADRAAALYNEVIMKDIMEAFAAGEDMSKGVFLNRQKTAIVEIRLHQGEFYLVYFKDIDEDRKAKENFAFHFQKTDVIIDYDGLEGTFAGQTPVDGNFYVFCRYLEAGIYELCKPSGHSVRKAYTYTMTSIFNYLKALSQKLGVVVQPAFQRNSGFPQQTSGAQADEGLPFVNTPVENVEATDMADMLS